MAARARRTSRPSEVFLSHSHRDHGVLLKIVGELRRHGIRVWYSEHHVGAAAEWIDQIGRALARCDWFILLVTPSALRSKWVDREFKAALTDDRYDQRIIPLVAKECDHRRMTWPIAGVQFIPFKGRSFEEAIRELLRVWGIG